MKIRVIIGAAAIFFIAAALYFIIRPANGGQQIQPNLVLPKIALQPMFYDETNFSLAIKKAENIKSEKDIQAVVVPHHLLASEYIAGLLKRASGRKIDTVVIIGPNHENISQEILASTLAKWQTPLGEVIVDSSLANRFFIDFNQQTNLAPFVHEHSVGAEVPFIKYYFSEARIMPVIINSYARLGDAEKLASWLAKNLPQNSLVLVSTDFSHYLTHEIAEKNDLQTRQWINNRDVETISRLNNDHIDSPISLTTVLLLAEKMGWQTKEIYHGNSFDFSVNKPVETTSYFGLEFVKP